MTPKSILTYAKAHVALCGAALTWYVAYYPDGRWVPYVSAAIALLTALGVLTVPNRRPKRKKPANDAGYTSIGVVGAVLIVIAVLILFGLLHHGWLFFLLILALIFLIV